MSDGLGYRGYVTARPIQGAHVPQHVQNLVIREHARQNGLVFKLSAVEYVMPGCYAMLETTLEELPQLDGIICYSLCMLPEHRERRRAVWDRLLGSGRRLVGALEGQTVATETDVVRVEDILAIRRALSLCPTRL